MSLRPPPHEKNRLLASYVDHVTYSANYEVTFAGKFVKKLTETRRIDLIRQFDSTLVHNMGTHLIPQDNWANHLFVNSFGFNEKGDKVYENPFLHKTTKQRIDWASRGSKKCWTHDQHRPSAIEKGKPNDGHSEPQFLEDMETFFLKDSNHIVDMFIPSADEFLTVTGFTFYGAFDACDACLHDLVEFRKKHQRGQTSVSQAIRDRLKDKFQGKDEDAFLLLYEAYYPYKSRSGRVTATYYLESKEFYHGPFTYLYNEQATPRLDLFVTDEEFEEEPYLQAHYDTLPLQEDLIFSHIHLLAGKSIPRKNVKCSGVSHKGFIFS